MFIDFLLKIFSENHDREAVVWKGRSYSYRWLAERIAYWSNFLVQRNVERGAVTSIEADFSPNSIALILALVQHGSILVPLASPAEANKSELLEIGMAEIWFRIDAVDEVSFQRLSRIAIHPLYTELRKSGHPGLVLFSSGSTGESKAVVHDFVGILEKFKVRRQTLRTIALLSFGHIGGANTLFYTLSNAGCVVTAEDRSPDTVLGIVAKYRVELLPTSPTFLNLLFISDGYRSHNTESLRTITYGTEPMPESTLRRSREMFPNVNFQQTYGSSEIGILRSKSRSSDSVWVKLGGEGFKTRIVDGMLQINARSAMLGYLNAPSPFTEDGWFVTGDAVEVDGDYFRILGRKSEVINVGGEKVYPTEIESVISELSNVAEVTVFAEKHPITGNIVSARIRMLKDEDPKSARLRIKNHCRRHLQAFKVPVKIEIVTNIQHSERLKKLRAVGPTAL